MRDGPGLTPHASVPGPHPLELEFPVTVAPKPADRRSRRAFRPDGKDTEDPERAKLLLHRLDDSARDRSIAVGVYPNEYPARVGQPKRDNQRKGLNDEEG